jgi:hypothetical protein
MSSHSGVPSADLAGSAPRDGDEHDPKIAEDDASIASVPAGEGERAVAAGRAPETPLLMILAVAGGVAALVAVALVAVIVARWMI